MMRQGFTLIELLVAIAVVLLVSGGIIANYNRYGDTQKVKQAALTVRANIRLAQSRANLGDKPASGCGALDGYRATFSASSYTVQAQCDGLPAGDVEAYSLGSPMTFSPVPSLILFHVLNQGIDADTDITVDGMGKTYRFTVYRNGDMSEVQSAP